MAYTINIIICTENNRNCKLRLTVYPWRGNNKQKHDLCCVVLHIMGLTSRVVIGSKLMNIIVICFTDTRYIVSIGVSNMGCGANVKEIAK